MLVSPMQNSGVGGIATPTPDTRYFASQWNIGFKVDSEKMIIPPNKSERDTIILSNVREVFAQI